MPNHEQSAEDYLSECFNLIHDFWNIINRKLAQVENGEWSGFANRRWPYYWATMNHYMWASDLILRAEGYR